MTGSPVWDTSSHLTRATQVRYYVAMNKLAKDFSAAAPKASIRSVLMLAAWFGLVAGMVEGAGLLLFQQINWERWGRITHVSVEIIWISAMWDFLLFVLVGLGVVLIARLLPKVPTLRFAIFLFGALMFYDWLALTERLTQYSIFVLALGLATTLVRIFGKYEGQLLRFWRTSFPWVAAVFVFALAGIQGEKWIAEKSASSKLAPAPAGAPNVVVIVVDTLRADHLSTYGYERATSPNIDRIANQGVSFENAIAVSSWTLPTHASMLTGRYPYEHGATDVKAAFAKPLDNRYPTLGEALTQHGYRAGAFSANCIYFSKDMGFGRGFIHFEDYFHSTFDGFSRTLYGRELARTILRRDKVRRLIIWLGFPAINELQPSSPSSWMVRKRASEVNREALHWIDRDSTRPFFVFLNYFDTHWPYNTPPGYPRKFVREDAHALLLYQQTSADSPTSRIAPYDESVAYVDDQIGKFFDDLKQRGLDQRTLVVVTSDHGELLGEHGLYAHQNTLYRPLLQVPLIFWQPGHMPAGLRIQGPISQAFFAATIMDTLGLTDAAVFPGPSLRILWNAQQVPSTWPDPLSELAQFKYQLRQFPSRYGSMTSLVTPQYHYMAHQQFGTELYDWVRDPDEAVNLAKTPAGEAVALDLAARVQSSLAQPR
jgi:arylsulfatase A-like enzyme